MQTLKNKAFRVSVQCLVRKLLSLERNTLTLIERSVFKIWIKIRRRKIKRLCFHQIRVTKTFYGGLKRIFGFNCFF
ncbi:hypothetical protein EC582_06745 [Helicobacter pylori]|nr:hypothetical protein EC582_06745 [Helicobacter pylori]